LFTSTEEAAGRVDGTEILERLHAELGNLRQALGWASEVPVDGTRVTSGLHLCIACGTYWSMRHDPADGAAMLDRLLSLVDPLMPEGTAMPEILAMVPPEVLAYARVSTMRVRGMMGIHTPPSWIHPMLDGAIAYFRETGNRRGEGRALLQLATFLDLSKDDGPDSLRAALGALEAATEAGDALTIVPAHNWVGVTNQRAGRDLEAGDDFARALLLAEASGDRTAIWFSCLLLGNLHFNRRRWDDADRYLVRNEGDTGTLATHSRWRRADIAMHIGDFPQAHEHLARLAEGIAIGNLPQRAARLHQLGVGRLARLEGKLEVATRCFETMLAGRLEATWPEMNFRVLAELALVKSGTFTGGVGELLSRALTCDPNGKNWYSPLPSLIAAVAEHVVARDPASGILIGAMASRLGTHAWYLPSYAQDEARITAILDQARETHGIPIPHVPDDLTASDAISECLEALASMDATQVVTQ
jgi:hypothetical protein